MGLFLRFIRVVFLSWVTLASGIISLGFLVYGKIKEEPPLSTYIKVWIIALFVSCYVAWREKAMAAKIALLNLEQAQLRRNGEDTLSFALLELEKYIDRLRALGAEKYNERMYEEDEKSNEWLSIIRSLLKAHFGEARVNLFDSRSDDPKTTRSISTPDRLAFRKRVDYLNARARHLKDFIEERQRLSPPV